MQDILNQLHQLQRELAMVRWDKARSRLDLLRASPDAKRQGLPYALLQASEQAQKALPRQGTAYCHDIARQALDELDSLLDRYAGWD